ncbi:MAG: hypothetical protein Kow0092_34260 [Deferrisomatales bacterium]
MAVLLSDGTLPARGMPPESTEYARVGPVWGGPPVRRPAVLPPEALDGGGRRAKLAGFPAPAPGGSKRQREALP